MKRDIHSFRLLRSVVETRVFQGMEGQEGRKGLFVRKEWRIFSSFSILFGMKGCSLGNFIGAKGGRCVWISRNAH